MGKRKEYHVVPGNDGWNVVRNNANRVSCHTEMKANAVAKARQLSQNSKSELIVHGRDGRIQYANSYGNDPYPPKDKK